jgi:hypothetical protein
MSEIQESGGPLASPSSSASLSASSSPVVEPSKTWGIFLGSSEVCVFMMALRGMVNSRVSSGMSAVATVYSVSRGLLFFSPNPVSAALTNASASTAVPQILDLNIGVKSGARQALEPAQKRCRLGIEGGLRHGNRRNSQMLCHRQRVVLSEFFFLPTARTQGMVAAA